MEPAMEPAQIAAGQVVMLFLLMGTGMLLAAGDLGCIVRSKPVWKLAAVRTGGHSAVTFSLPAFFMACSGRRKSPFARILPVLPSFGPFVGSFANRFSFYNEILFHPMHFHTECRPAVSATFYRNATITHGFLRLDLLL